MLGWDCGCAGKHFWWQNVRVLLELLLSFVRVRLGERAQVHTPSLGKGGEVGSQLCWFSPCKDSPIRI